MPYTQIKILTSQDYSVSNNTLQKYADDIQAAWNSAVEDSNGDYSMYAKMDSGLQVNISDRSTISDARVSAKNFLLNNHSGIFGDDAWDAILISDDYGYNGQDIGMAPVGKCPPQEGVENLVAGGGVSDSDQVPVALVTTHTASSGIGAHEVGHMYGGNHYEFEHWGVAEYTAMGNPGTNSCYGNETELRARRADYGACTVTAFRDYLDYWSNKGYFNP